MFEGATTTTSRTTTTAATQFSLTRLGGIGWLTHASVAVVVLHTVRNHAKGFPRFLTVVLTPPPQDNTHTHTHTLPNASALFLDRNHLAYCGSVNMHPGVRLSPTSPPAVTWMSHLTLLALNWSLLFLKLPTHALFRDPSLSRILPLNSDGVISARSHPPARGRDLAWVDCSTWLTRCLEK